MKTLVALGLTFAFLFYGAHTATVTFKNKCGYKVWAATLIGDNKPQLSTTGFELAENGGQRAVDVPAPFSGRFWGRTHCSTDASGRFSCLTGDCSTGQVSCNGATGKNPASLAEFTVQQNRQVYDISLVDGFNLPLSISPINGSGDKCTSTTCPANINSGCPDQLAVKNGNSVIACKSACEAFKKPEYCCTENFEPRGSCPPTNYSKIFKDQCPQAYSYAHDDETSTFTCDGGTNFDITFCP